MPYGKVVQKWKVVVGSAFTMIGGTLIMSSFQRKSELADLIANDPQVSDSYLVGLMNSQAQDLIMLAFIMLALAIGFLISGFKKK